MTSYLVDLNVWLAMTWSLHRLHASASRWYASTDDSALLFCRLTMLGFLRLLTNQKVMGDSTVTLSDAFAFYDEWILDPRVELAAEPREAEYLFREALAGFAGQSATNTVADCYLVGFAETSGAHLVTFDRGLARTAKKRNVPVTLLHTS